MLSILGESHLMVLYCIVGGFTSDIQGPNVDDMKESTTVHSKKVDEPFP